MTAAAPTIVALETNSAWVVVVAVSFVTLATVLLLRRLIDRPAGFTSGLLLSLPLLVPVIAAVVHHQGVLPEIAVLRPAARALIDSPGRNLLHFLLLSDERGRVLIPYALSGSTGPWLVLIGLSVSSFMLIRRLVGGLAVRRLLRRCTVVESSEAPVVRITSELAARARLKRSPELLVLPDGVSGAFTKGGRGGKILLSKDLLDSLDPEELEAIVAHEMSHLKARDVQLVFIAGLLRDMVAWNPLAHVAFRRLISDRELEADRQAAVLTGNPLSVASSLVKVCELMTRQKGLAQRASLAFLKPAGRITRRVNRLIRLADGGAVASPSSNLPYLVAACLAIVVGLQAGARIAQQDQSAFAIVWGAPEASGVTMWSGQASARDVAATRRYIAQGAAHERLGKRVTEKRLAAQGFAHLGRSYALQEQDLPKWMRAMSAWAKRRGLSSKKIMSQIRMGWRAVPLFSEPRFGAFGIYRIEPDVLNPLVQMHSL